MRNNIQPKLNALGIYQIIGGILGLVFSYPLLNISFSTIALINLLFTLGFYGFSMCCGVLLLQKHKLGMICSKINQLLQVGQLAMFGYGITCISGVAFSIGLDLTEGALIVFNLAISNWKITVNSEPEIMMVKLNLVALFLIVAIDRWQNKLEAIEIEQQITSIGSEPAVSHL